MMANSLRSYRQVAQECIDAFNRVDVRREEGYCVRSGLFSANLTNFLPAVPETSHEALYTNLIRNLALEKFDRQLMHLSDVSALEGDLSLIGSTKKPHIFCTFHIGSYRLIANILLRKGHQFSTLVRQEVFESQQAEFKSYCNSMRDTFGTPSRVNILNAEDPRVLLQMTRELQAGRSILVYIDGDTGTGEEHKTTVKFLNQQVKVRKGIPYASFLSGVPILPVVQYRKKNLQNVLRIGKPITVRKNESREEYSQRSLSMIYKYFGEYIEKYPDQWEGWCYIHNSLVIKPQSFEAEVVESLSKKRTTYRFNQGRYRIFELESSYLLFDRTAYETFEITADMKSYLSNPVVKNPIKILGEGIFGELLTRHILI
jgi:lauroyl/myristoyl acyltransferase